MHERNFERFLSSFASDEQVEWIHTLVMAEVIRRKAKVSQVDGFPAGTTAASQALFENEE
jgi:hypothetical protein